MSIRIAAALIALATLLTACGECCDCTDGGSTPSGRIELVGASTLSVRADESGTAVIEVVIPEGSPGAGTYRTDNTDLLGDAALAMAVLGEDGATVHIEVDEAGEIVKLGHAVVVE